MLCTLLPLTALASNVGDSLVVGIQSTKTALIRPLDPKERDIMSVYDLIYEGLVTIDDDYTPQPCLAESWEQTGDGKTWTFHLRTDVIFSDGTPLTAQDVVATAQYILARANDKASAEPGYYCNLKYFVSSISASGDHTVVVKADSGRKYYGILYAMTFPVLPQDRVESDNPPGTGPYVLSTFEAGNYLWLQANTSWWQTHPQVKEIMFMCHDSPRAVIESYEYARVDTIFTRSLSGSQYKSGTSALSIDARTNQLEVLLINHSSFPLGDANIRKAIRYVIDPDIIANNVYMGMVTRTDTPMIPGTWMYNNNLDSYFVQNIDEAKRLLEEAGWSDSDGDNVLDKPKDDGSGLYRLHLRICVYEEPENDVRVETANTIKDALAQVGIECEVQIMTMGNAKERLQAGSFDLALASFAMDVCPDPGFMLMKGNSGNYSRYKSDDMTTLCKELRTQTTKDGYQNALYRIQEKFAQDCPFICLFYRSSTVLTRRMFTTMRDIRELELLRGIEYFHSN